MFGRSSKPDPIVDFYAPRFSHHLQSGEVPLNAGSGYNVSWAMEHGDSPDNGLLILSDSRLFHCLDYGIETWSTRRENVLGVSVSHHPMPQTENLHITFFDGAVHAQMTFYCHPRFVKAIRRALGR